MNPDITYTRTLKRAIEAVGSEAELAQRLSTSLLARQMVIGRAATAEQGLPRRFTDRSDINHPTDG